MVVVLEVLGELRDGTIKARNWVLSREVVVALGCELMSCEKCEKGR